MSRSKPFPAQADHGSNPFVRELLLERIGILNGALAEQEALIDTHEEAIAECRDRIYQAVSQLDEFTQALGDLVERDEAPAYLGPKLPFDFMEKAALLKPGEQINVMVGVGKPSMDGTPMMPGDPSY